MAVFLLLLFQVLVPRQITGVWNSDRMEWCQGKPSFCNCSSLLWKIQFSNFQTLKKIEVTVRSSIRQFNIMRKSGGLKKGLSKDA